MISAVVLTHNNESIIEKCLKSLLWCDEIVIVDDNSTDETLKVAKIYTQKIFKHKLSEDFSAQRNFGLSKISGDWVLYIDSDEIISDELKKEIISVISNKEIESKYSGFMLKRIDFFLGLELKHGETSKVKLLRLAKNNSGTWRRAVHEVWDIKGVVGELQNPIKHYSHGNINGFIDKLNYYSTINANYFYKEGIKSNFLQIIFYPLAKFVQNYIFRLGFLDGTAGFVMAGMMSFHSFLTRSKLYLLDNKNQ